MSFALVPGRLFVAFVLFLTGVVIAWQVAWNTRMHHIARGHECGMTACRYVLEGILAVCRMSRQYRGTMYLSSETSTFCATVVIIVCSSTP